METIILICENVECANKLEEEARRLGYNIKFEVQEATNIVNKISIDDIKNAKAVLFALNRRMEDIEDIERFIDIEYYEVEPIMAINNSKQVIQEIISDLNK